MEAALEKKLAKLKATLRDTGGCAVAYSGGVDSTLLLAVAHEVLGERCLAVTATSSTYARRECESALAWVRERKIPFVEIVALPEDSFDVLVRQNWLQQSRRCPDRGHSLHHLREIDPS